MGGFLVGRAAAFEHYAVAIILNNGVYDFGNAFHKEVPAIGKLLLGSGWNAILKTLMGLQMRSNTGLKWAVLNLKWAFGLASRVKILCTVKQYTLKGIVKQIKTPTLVLDSPDNHFLKGQPKELFNRLICNKTFIEMTTKEGADAHCHIGSGHRFIQVVFD